MYSRVERLAAITLVAGTMMLCWAPAVGAQTAGDSALYRKAQEMVSNGEAEAGRKLVDSLVNAAPMGSAAYAEGLYWRATLSNSGTAAERDYRRIVVDYPLSPRVADALLRMGELEAARGDRDAALQHFQRLTLEHPESPLRAEANYWVANTYLAKNDLQRGCAANADALAQVNASNVELRNRIDYQQQRCRNVVIAQKGAPVPAATSTASAPRSVPVTSDEATGSESTSTTTVSTATTSSVKSGAKGATKSVTRATNTRATKATKATTAAGGKAAKPGSPTRVARENARDAAASPTSDAPASSADVPAATPTPTPTPSESTATHRDDTAATSARSAAASSGGSSRSASGSGAPVGTYSVQVAAYRTRPAADSLAAKLRTRGYLAHVDGTSAPFRVRVGHYFTQAAAAAELHRLEAKGIKGFVSER